MAEQLALDFPCETAFGEDDYFISEANRFAAEQVGVWENWPHNRLLILGPTGAGKTHLAQIWCKWVDAVSIDLQNCDPSSETITQKPALIENIEVLDPETEQTLFHLLNLFGNAGQSMLLTARGTVTGLGLSLPDLESRLRQITQVEIKAPDDDLLLAVLMKQFQDRQLAPSPRVIGFLAKRMGRSFEAITGLVADIDRISLQSGGKVTMESAKKALAKHT